MQIFSKETVEERTLDYFDGDDLAAGRWMNKYALKVDDDNYLEDTPARMHDRLAQQFERIERSYKLDCEDERFLDPGRIFQYMDRFQYFVPQGSPMAGIGNFMQVQSLSNCFVIESPADSYGGICWTDQELAQLMKRRGGVGVEMSTLRPADAPVQNAARTSCGVPLMAERFSRTTREVGQEGRRGALMLSLFCIHPDLPEFITMKRDLGKVTGANVSVQWTDEFLNAVLNDEEIQLKWPVHSSNPTHTRTVRAKEIWDTFIDCAWETAEPGCLFMDNFWRGGPQELYAIFRTLTVNPCAELNQPANESCRLAALNLFSFVINPFTPQARFDYEAFRKAAGFGLRMMDNMIDLELECIERIQAKIEEDPEEEHIKDVERRLWEKIRHMAEQGRRVGLGITGLGDTIAALGVKYGSKKAINITEKIYKNLCLGAYEESILLAKERGAFPAFCYETEKDSPFIKCVLAELSPEIQDIYAQYGRRNVACLTTAPTGTVSMMTQTTSGIEPLFLPWYDRKVKINPGDKDAIVHEVDDLGDSWTIFKVIHPKLKLWAKINDKDPVKDFEESPYFGACANDIDWVASVEQQARAQKWVDHAISRTVNLPADVSKEVVNDVYMTAWRLGCKGITVYRDGSRSGVLTSGDKQEERHSPSRPEELSCDIHVFKYKGEDRIAVVGLLDEQPYELFIGKVPEDLKVSDLKKHKEGKLVKRRFATVPNKYDLYFNGSCIKDIGHYFSDPETGTLTRLVSLSLRHGAEVSFICEQLLKNESSDFNSIVRCTARVLKKYIQDGQKAQVKLEGCPHEEEANIKCNVVYEDGCVKCVQCGLSKCG